MTQEKETHITIREALLEFATSPRFNFLKGLKVGPILGDYSATLGTISDMTFEQLSHSIEDYASELHRITPAQERLLVAVLQALSEGDNSGGEENEEESSTTTTFNSVQCELELRERINRLKGHPDLARILDARVGQFWESGEPRAPFEESFTIKQLLGLDLAVLAKKRSMTSGRMVSLARALERAERDLSGSEDNPAAAPPSSAHFVSALSELTQGPIVISSPSGFAPRRPDHRWAGTFGNRNIHERALVEGVMSALCSEEESELIRDALITFSESFSAHDLLDLVAGEEISPRAGRALREWLGASPLKSYQSIVRATLQSPGVHISKIATLLSGGAESRVIHDVVATLLVRGLGASQVTLGRNLCREVWTTNPSLISIVAREAQAKRRVAFPNALKSTCPELDPILHSWLCGVVRAVRVGKKRR